MKSIIEVQNLSKAYKKKTVLDKLSFRVNNGEIVALLGENGAGKSTLINLLNHLSSKDSGDIFIMGTQDIPSIRESISVMPQNNLSLNKITVKEILNLARSYYKHPLSYEELINLAGLKESENRYVSLLSGGQKRRLTFAATMAGNPQLIFLDEPTAGMDSQSRRNFWQRIAEYRKQGKTFFVTSHYLEELDTIADRIMILKDAHLVYDGTLVNLRQRSGEIVISFTTTLPKDAFANLQSIKELFLEEDSYQLITTNVSLTIEELTPLLSQLSDLRVQESSLESLYEKLTKE
ncbi:ABC transporter ATP-binding protein [Enterococcus sp. YC2-6]|jgi:ABC-2 type transport system ATP-binding protein|uniref:ABC transporter ATP-binding protein n=1 Tax=Enterococcus sp. YC2-6 TaxID=2874514 RepID=UPI00201F8E9D|nr:ABC transporter ATP-binding protein [Enterococcus sp. YC2-6]